MSSSQILAEISVNLTVKTGPVSLKASEVSPSDLAALSRFRLLMAFSNSLRVGRLTLICHSSCLEIMGNSCGWKPVEMFPKVFYLSVWFSGVWKVTLFFRRWVFVKYINLSLSVVLHRDRYFKWFQLFYKNAFQTLNGFLERRKFSLTLFFICIMSCEFVFI